MRWHPTWLLYFQGGAAWGHTSTNITFGGFQIGQTSNTRTGWTIGGGVEWMFAPHWSAFLEGNWMDFGGPSGTAVTPAGFAVCAVRLSLERQSDRGHCPGRRELQILVSESR